MAKKGAYALSPMNRLIDTSDEKTSFFDEIKELDHAVNLQKAYAPDKVSGAYKVRG